MLPEFITYVVSIGVSDAIEFQLNPLVHRIHNVPDIMRLPWEHYGTFDAFLSGIYCSWVIVLMLLIFWCLRVKPNWLYWLSLVNILIPIVCYVTGLQQGDPFLSHRILYLLGIAYFIIMIVVVAFGNEPKHPINPLLFFL